MVLLLATAVTSDRDCVLGPLARLRALDRAKDRAVAPDDAHIDRSVTLDAMLAPGDDRHRFVAGRGAEIDGWVVGVQVGGVELANCFARNPKARDTHIELAVRQGAARTERVIVEVTPRWRGVMRASGADWSTDALRTALIGRRVRVRGWLLFDATHDDAAAHSDPRDTRGEPNWRATAWELHPITAITLLP